MGQSLGMRVGMEISDNKIINNSPGLGGYLNIDEFSDKFEILIYGNYTTKEGAFNDCLDCSSPDIFTNYKRGDIGVSGLFVIPLIKELNFKFGPDINYNWINASRQGQILSWIESYKARFVGPGIMTNLNYQQVFKLPINIDFFLIPNYLLKVKDFNDQSGYSMYNRALKILNI